MGKESRKLTDILATHSAIAIDTPVFIYHFEAHPHYQGLTTGIFQAVEEGGCKAVTSTLTRLELLVRPLSKNRHDIVNTYKFLLDTFPNLEQIAVDRDIADKAAELRAGSGLATPDSLRLATALNAGATLFITNDSGFSQEFDEMEILLLDSLV